MPLGSEPHWSHHFLLHTTTLPDTICLNAATGGSCCLYATLAASLFWIIINPPNKIIAAHYSGSAWLFLAVFSFLSMLLPFTLYFAGLKLLVPTKAIIASCLEPVFAI